MNDNRYFYRALPRHTMALEDLLGEEHLFEKVPKDWHVVVVDIQNSTQAVKNGLHHDVNLTATGAIIAMLNKAKEIDKKLNIPYFFGGDGATFIVPDFFLEKTLSLLEQYRHHIRKNLFLSLKVGSLKVEKVYKSGSQIKIAKYDVNASLIIPIVLGTGLKKAESIIKSYFIDDTNDQEYTLDINLEGMECRWDEIAPPIEQEKILCLLANCPDDKMQSQVFQSIVFKLNDIFGNYKARHPISTSKLKLNATFKKITKEMYARIGKYNYWYLIKNWFITFIGQYYFIYFKEGKSYLTQISELSYTLMIDGSINSVISGTQEEIDELIHFLDKLESEGKIKYGVHVTYASVLSCYVEDRKDKHIHFVDGAEGGFTTASKMIKAKMSA